MKKHLICKIIKKKCKNKSLILFNLKRIRKPIIIRLILFITNIYRLINKKSI